MGLRSGRRYEYFVTPWLDGWSNASVPVQAGLTTDLGKTFVMDPGFVGGAINLFGPPQGNYLSMLRHDADFDYDGNGLPDNLNLGSTHVQAWGTPTRAEGATFTARGGQARVGFVANYLAESASIKGDYQMVLGGLNGEASVWNPSYLTLKFVNQSTPQEPVSYQYSHQQIDNRNVSNQTIIPGQETVVDHEYCMSEVRLSYVSLAGQFYNPTARAYGVFSGVDFKGDNADYRVSLWYANGTPIKAGEASDRGLVAMILPQGAYNITPKVTAVNPNGSTSNTELPPVIIDVGCRQVITLTTELQIDLDELLLAAEDGQLLLSGTLNSSASVLLLTYQHNGGEEVIICTDCGIDPSFSATITLQLGENTIVVAGLDALGGEASIISNVDYEPVIVEPPVTDPLKVIGCLNKTVKVQSFESGTTVNFDIGVSGGCGEPQVTCNPASGSYFGLGAGRVDCYAVDSCGGLSECTFNIDIEAEAIPESEEEPACSNTSDKPYLSQTVSRELLWPPNHKLVDVGLMTTVNDPCSDTSERMTSLLTEVWSDETEVPVKGDGSGHFAPDAKDMATQLRLRAERRGKEDGRVYLIISKAGNVDGIQGVACSAVIVPRSKGKRDLADAYAQAEEAQAHCVEHAAAPAGFSLHGVSEEMGPKK